MKERQKLEERSCYYECLVGCEPDKNECKRDHPDGCETCDYYLVDPPEDDDPTGSDPDFPF